MNIRLYKDNDFEMINHWWIIGNTYNFNKDFIPNSSFIIEENNIPLAFISLYELPIKEYAIVENLVGNPEYKGLKRKEAVNQLHKFVEFYAKYLGYKKLHCLAKEQKLVTRYEDLGYKVTCNTVTSFIMEI